MKNVKRNQISIFFYVWIFRLSFFKFSHQHFSQFSPLTFLLPFSKLVWCVLLPFSQYLTLWIVKKWNREQWKLGTTHRMRREPIFFVHLPNYQFNFFVIKRKAFIKLPGELFSKVQSKRFHQISWKLSFKLQNWGNKKGW